MRRQKRKTLAIAAATLARDVNAYRREHEHPLRDPVMVNIHYGHMILSLRAYEACCSADGLPSISQEMAWWHEDHPTQRAPTPGDCRWCATELDSSDGDGLCGRCSRASQECFFDTEGCCGDPADHDYCGLCPLATAEHPDRNGGWPGKSSTQRAPDEERLRQDVIDNAYRWQKGGAHTSNVTRLERSLDALAALTPPDETGQ